MIFIVVKFTVRGEYADSFLDRIEEFTLATRAEPGNLFFEWSRAVADPNEFVLLEAFASADAGKEHVESAHFKAAMAWLPNVVARTPRIVNVEVPGDGWARMAEVTPA
ncbi:quinol monooxygenase YgiN [Saccharomonospora amisosensis]|uniref:Quinol monooxygenase YgiN n=1 Tax=Saccharomonospora amisosensis TaxID=1128677 RepID=A0A7X5UQS1_9PSEU|nr:putative quinol monooxygenase [Saccharomonospora amisosensis]NIJ12436.1 quinol monooxygenase YgiN [Saccharomonospora amisosensis]